MSEKQCPDCKGEGRYNRVAPMSAIDTGDFEDYGGWIESVPCYWCNGKGTIKAKPDAVSTMLDELVKQDGQA